MHASVSCQVQRNVTIFSVCIAYSGYLIYQWARLKLLAPISSQNATFWNQKLICDAQHALFFSEKSQCSDILHPEFISGHHYILAIIGAIASCKVYLQCGYADLYVLFATLTVWAAAKQFSTRITNRNADPAANKELAFGKSSNIVKSKTEIPTKASWEDVYRTYKSIKRLCDLINHCLGSLLTIFIARLFLAVLMALDNFFATKSFHGGILLVAFSAMFSAVFYFAASTYDLVRFKYFHRQHLHITGFMVNKLLSCSYEP